MKRRGFLGEKLGRLGSGEQVFDRPKSHLQMHQDKDLETHLPDALLQIYSNDREFIHESIDFKEDIGKTNCVATNDQDKILFAKRKGRKGYSRFVKNREKEPTSFITTVLKKIPEGYILITAFLGPKVRPEPWDPNAEEDSEDFWMEHALIWEEETVVPGTQTEDSSVYFF